jgi:hypothetical protein
MSVQPQLVNAPGPQGVTQRIADIQRQVRELQQQASSLPAGSVSGTTITPGTLPATAIVASSITATQISAGAITAGAIAANAVTAGTIAANAVTATNIASNAVTTNAIATGAVTASKISVTNLQAVSAAMGTVTGGIFQTGSSGARVMMGTGIVTSMGTNNGIIGVDGSGNVTFFIDATTGNVSLEGTLQQGSSGLGNIQGITQNAILQIQGNNLCDNGGVDGTSINMFSRSGATGTIARDTTTYLTAPASLKYTQTTGTGTVTIAFEKASTTRIPATAAAVYSGSCFMLNSATTNRTVVVGVGFYNSGGSLIGSVTLGPNITAWPGQWVRAYVENVTAPAGTVTMQPLVEVSTVASGDVYNFDNFMWVNQPSAQGSIIIADSITATEIAAGTITGTQIAATTITASNLNVATLDAITGNMGTLTAGTITGATITGSVVETSSSDPRVYMDTTNALYVTNASSVVVASLSENGLVLAANITNIILFEDTSANITGGMENGSSSTTSTTTISANSPPNSNCSSFIDFNSDSVNAYGNYIRVWAVPGSGGASALLLDGTGVSGFLQCGGYKSGVTSGTLSFPGGSYDGNLTSFSCPGCSSQVWGVMTVSVLSNGAGAATARTQYSGSGGILYLQASQSNRSLGAPASGTTIGYTLLWWGL